MKLKPLLIAVVLLAGLAAAAWYLNRPITSPLDNDSRVEEPVLTRDMAAKIGRVSLSEKGKTVMLTNDPANRWRVTSDHNLPLELTKLTGLIKTLTDTTVERLVTTSTDRLDRLGFSDTKIMLMDTTGAPLLTLVLGKNAEGGGRFIKFGDENKAYLARLDTWIDTTPRNWVDKVLVPFSADDVAKISLPFPDGKTLIATRSDKNGDFTATDAADGQQLKKTAVSTLLNSLASLRFKDISAVDDPHAMAARKTARDVTLTMFDGKALTFAIGREPEHLEMRPDAAKPDWKRLDKMIGEASEPTPENPDTAQSGSGDLIKPLAQKAPAGPVYAFIHDSDTSALINTLMMQQAFQVAESALRTLPEKNADLFEPVPATEKQTK